MKVNLTLEDGTIIGTAEIDVNVLKVRPKPQNEAQLGLGLDSRAELADERSEEAGSSRSSETLKAVSSNNKRTVRNVSADDDGISAADVKRVHEEHVRLFEPRSKRLTPSQERTIRKGLREATVEECVRALQGLKAYRSAGHPGRTDLSTVFATYPGSSPLRERIDFWIDQAEPGAQPGAGFPSAPPEKVRAAKRDVLMAHSMEGSEMARRKGEEAETWLREHGIETVREVGGHATFIAMGA